MSTHKPLIFANKSHHHQV